MFGELLPEAKTVGILYCSAEANSLYQYNIVAPALEKMGITVKQYTFADSNEIANVVTAACSECDALYIPTDNTAASCTEVINNVALTAKTPIICGDEGTCVGCGIATLCISYYDIGHEAGNMAIEILENGTDPGSMDIRFAPQAVKKYNASVCEALGIEIPSEYTAIE